MTEGMTAYSGLLKRIIKVKVGKIHCNVDRPEQTAQCQVCAHGSWYGTCFGYAADVDGSCRDNRLPSCEHCRKVRVQDQLGLTQDSSPIIEDNNASAEADLAKAKQSIPDPEEHPTKVEGPRIATYFHETLYYGSSRRKKKAVLY